MKIMIFVVGIIIIIPAIIIGSLLLRDGTENTPEWQIRNLRIWKQTPAWELALAVKHQNAAKIEQLTKAHPELLNYQEPRYGATLLIWAVGVEKYKSAEALLKCGADPNIATTSAGETALFVAAGYSWVDSRAKKDPKYVKLLLKYGANPNINYAGIKQTDGIYDATEPGTSPLMRSIGCGIGKTKAIVEGGADINYKTPSGKTAAIEALSEGGTNVTDEYREYAYYLIVERKAKVTEPYYPGKVLAIPGIDQNKKMYPVDNLRDWIVDLHSKGYTMKMEIVKEFARQGVDYRKTRILDRQMQQIQQIYPNTWQEYIKKY